MKCLFREAVASAAILAVVIGNARADESGTIDFDTDPGFTTIDTGGDANASYSVRTSDSIADFSMNRDNSVERIFLPLTQDYVGNGSNAKMRIRFAINGITGSGTDLPMGVFRDTEGNGGGLLGFTSLTGPMLEAPGSGSGTRHHAGGAINVDAASDLSAATWYVWEFEFQAAPQTSNWTLY